MRKQMERWIFIWLTDFQEDKEILTPTWSVSHAKSWQEGDGPITTGLIIR